MTFLRARAYQRWTELVDRESTGTRLSGEEERFVREFSLTEPLCRREQALIQELEDMTPTAEAANASIVRAALEETSPRADLISVGVRPPRPRLRRRWYAAGVLTAAAVAVLGWLERDRPTDELALARSELVFAAGTLGVDGQRLDAAGTLLAQGQTLQTGRGGACLSIDPGIDVCLSAHSRLRLSNLQGAERRLDLLEGSVVTSLEPQPRGGSFSIVAGDVWSTAVGTAFSVELDPGADQVRTTVLHGSVQVRNADDAQLVRAHHRATRSRRSKKRGSKLAVSQVSRTEESRHWGALHLGPLWKSPRTATLELRELPGRVWLDGDVLGQAPLSSLIPPGSHTFELRDARGTLGTLSLVAQPGRRIVLTREMFGLKSMPPEGTDETEQPRPELPSKSKRASAKPPSVGAILARAHRSMQRRDWAAAAAAYQRLRTAFPKGPEAHTALVSLAKLELDRLRRPGRALRLTQKYLRRGGALDEEARLIRIGALGRLGHSKAEREAIEDFLRRHPESLHADSFRNRLREASKSR